MMIHCQSARRYANVKRDCIAFTKTIYENKKSGVFTWTKHKKLKSVCGSSLLKAA